MAMTTQRDTVTLLTAAARTGKSCYEVARLVNVVLRQYEGPVYTNLPLRCEAIAEYVSRKWNLDYYTTIQRLNVIPREVEASWRDAGRPIYDDRNKQIGAYPNSGPWDYFEDKPLSGATIIIDEIHNFCGSQGTPRAVVDRWSKWLGEISHNQCVFRCISQAPQKIHTVIKHQAGAEHTIENTGLIRDPFVKIEVYDWLELWCGFTGSEMKVFVFEQEARTHGWGKFRGKREMFLMGEPYFSFYDSFNAPIAHTQSNVKPFEHEYERRLRKGAIVGRLSLLWWFFLKNAGSLFVFGLKLSAIFAFYFFMMGGGVRWAMDTFRGGRKAVVSGEKPVDGAKTGGSMNSASRQGGADGDHAKQIEALRSRLNVVEDERDKAVRRSTELEAQLSRFSELRLMTPESVVFGRGRAYGVGDLVELDGSHKGKKIEEIDFRNRRVRLSGGDLLYLSD